MIVTNFTGTAQEQHKIDITNIDEFLKSRFQHHCSNMDILSYGIFKSMGWKYDFKEHLDRFLVKQYGSWQEYYCINKTTLRSCLFGCIQEIVKIDNKHKAK